MTIHDDSWAHVSVSSHSPKGQDPELSALDIPPPTSGGQFITANVKVVFPTPRMRISSLGPVLTFVRETKGKSLEELGQIFAVYHGGRYYTTSIREREQGGEEKVRRKVQEDLEKANVW
ncbi:hypothetical protein F4604DRAFT_1925580 [Suillus subluteus]|nr:hypothetical protein F4604DRAFT_1925580 [Suillus subluteus]